MSRGDVRGALLVATEQQAFLIKRWEEIHGRAE